MPTPTQQSMGRMPTPTQQSMGRMPTPTQQTGAPAPQQHIPQSAGPADNAIKLPLNSFPPAVQQALKKAWDKEGAGYVTVGELCAGANGSESARKARQQRTLQGLGKYKQQMASQQQYKNDKFYSELPGDLSHLDNVGLAEGQGIWERMQRNM